MEMMDRINRTMLISVAWLILITAGLAFNPMRFSFVQNVAAFLVSGLVAFGGVVLTWTDIISEC